MKLYFIFTKKGLAVMLALIVSALIILGQFLTVNHRYFDGSTHSERMEFLSLYNLKVNETAVAVKETRIPDEISGAAEEYNRILQKAGFDLTNFRGKDVTVYTYKIDGFSEKQVNILVCNEKIIAGDITDNLNGITVSLTKEK